MNKRINYIDNLRSITVSLLIVFHLAIAYNSWGEANYIFFQRVNLIAFVVVFINPWFMPLMFLLAGVSSAYSLKKRGYTCFLKERLLRLGIPLVFGILFLNPILSFIADKTHNGYEGNYLKHYKIYFTEFTDLTGYDGGFTLGHLWFIAVLILISFVSCGIIKIIDNLSQNKKKTVYLWLNVILIVGAVATFDIRIFGKPLITFFCVYLLGYYLFSNQNWAEKLAKFKWIFVIIFLAASVTNSVLYIYVENMKALNTVCCYLSFAVGLPALFCLGHDYLDYSNNVSRYASKLSYVFYIIHFPIVILCQYFLSLTDVNYIVNFFLSLLISYPLTCVFCFLIDKSTYAGVLFGLKSKK